MENQPMFSLQKTILTLAIAWIACTAQTHALSTNLRQQNGPFQQRRCLRSDDEFSKSSSYRRPRSNSFRKIPLFSGGKDHASHGIHTYTAKFLEDNGLEFVTDEETGTFTARPYQGEDINQELTTNEQLHASANGNVNTSDSVSDNHTRPDKQNSNPKLTTTQTNRSNFKGNKQMEEHTPKVSSMKGGFNVVLTHCTADFDSLASAVGLAKLWSSPHGNIVASTPLAPANGEVVSTAPTKDQQKKFDDYDSRAIPTYVVLPRGAHPAVQRFLALHKHLFPIRSLKSLPTDLTGLNRLGLVDAQRRDRVGPAEPLIAQANRVIIVDHHIDSESDIPEATDYVVDSVGSVSTMVVERLMAADIEITEAEATLLALGIHADTGSLCFDSTTPRDAKALAWVMEQRASQAAIAEHAQSSLSDEQQGVLTQALLNTNSSVVYGVTVSTVLLRYALNLD